MINVKVRGYTGTGWGSGFIQRWTRSPISHVSICFYMDGADIEVESLQGKGVISHPPHSREDKTFTEYDVPLSYEQAMEARALAISLVGSKYDYLAIKSFLIHRKKHNLYKWICSEIVAYVLLKVGYALSRRSPHLESPSTCCDSLRLVEQTVVLEIGSS